jgi:phosphatidylserine decarboxylase
VSQIGHIDADRLLQAKGFDFSLKDLLGGSAELAALFQDGEFATIYLSPKDYHRVHMPFSGTLRETVFIPGRLFSVSQQTALDVPRLFARNERLVCLFETAIGPMAVILVGAMLVGSIRTAWGSPLPSRHIKREIYPASGAGMLKLARGEELGYFQMGSTVITLFPKGKIAWAPTLAEMSPTLVGQNMASLIPS